MDAHKFDSLTRRNFISLASAGALASVVPTSARSWTGAASGAKPALLGGTPIRSSNLKCTWPLWTPADEDITLKALHQRIWSRGEMVNEFEKKFARMMGAPRCLATNCGTYALVTSLHCLGVGGGDEVITTPYTFVATIDAILLLGALPVFVDIDPATFMIHPDKIEEKITEHTVAIVPVHMGGEVCHMDKINAVARKHNLKVVEDACQGHMAEWKGKKTGTLADLGCFSFQASKDIACGEGGAILGRDNALMDHCYSYHNFGRSFGSVQGWGYPVLGTKCRMAEYQASILLSALDRVPAQYEIMKANEQYLTAKLKQIPGIIPRASYSETTAIGHYTYCFRYQKEHFHDLPRKKFLKALEAEGIPFGLGSASADVGHHQTVNKSDSYLEKTLRGKTFQKIYSPQRLDHYRQMCLCPEMDKLSKELCGCDGKTLFLETSPKDMDDIANAILKIRDFSEELKNM